MKRKSKAKIQRGAAKPAPASKPTTYTVGGKTFATKAEAEAYKKQLKAAKPCEIKEGTRAATHRIVSFTAKK